MTQRSVTRAFGYALLALVAVACQRIDPPTPTPTTDQWRRVQENLLDEAPAPQHAVDAVFGDTVRLLGWDVSPEQPEVGQEVALTFYWEVLQATEDRWSIFVHLDSNTRQNVDHEAIDDLYPTVYWEPGQIIRDTIEVTLSTDITSSDVRVLTGFFRDEDRMDVREAGQGTLEEDGRLFVGAFPVSWDAPTYTIRWSDGPIEVDGRPNDRPWARAQRTPTWTDAATGEPVEGMNTWAKMLWDETSLYVLISARDSDIVGTIDTRDGEVWSDDALELAFDPTGDGESVLSLRVNPLGTLFDGLFVGGADAVTAEVSGVDIEGLQVAVNVQGTTDDREDRDRNWTAEFSIPLHAIPGLPQPPPTDVASARGNFMRIDHPTDSETRRATWSPSGTGAFVRPTRFGVFTFEAAPVVEGSAEGSGDGPAASRRELLRRRTFEAGRGRGQ